MEFTTSYDIIQFFGHVHIDNFNLFRSIATRFLEQILQKQLQNKKYNISFYFQSYFSIINLDHQKSRIKYCYHNDSYYFQLGCETDMKDDRGLYLQYTIRLQYYLNSIKTLEQIKNIIANDFLIMKLKLNNHILFNEILSQMTSFETNTIFGYLTHIKTIQINNNGLVMNIKNQEIKYYPSYLSLSSSSSSLSSPPISKSSRRHNNMITEASLRFRTYIHQFHYQLYYYFSIRMMFYSFILSLLGLWIVEM
jgi:hypothetical protein